MEWIVLVRPFPLTAFWVQRSYGCSKLQCCTSLLHRTWHNTMPMNPSGLAYITSNGHLSVLQNSQASAMCKLAGFCWATVLLLCKCATQSCNRTAGSQLLGMGNSMPIAGHPVGCVHMCIYTCSHTAPIVRMSAKRE